MRDDGRFQCHHGFATALGLEAVLAWQAESDDGPFAAAAAACGLARDAAALVQELIDARSSNTHPPGLGSHALRRGIDAQASHGQSMDRFARVIFNLSEQRQSEFAAHFPSAWRLIAVDDAGQINRSWLDGRQCVGLTAGASAPEELVRAVVDRLCEWGAEVAEESQGRSEKVTFSLPRALQG